MTVYVDDMAAPYGRMKMCHCASDVGSQELLAMMDKIGVQRKWLQAEGTYREHFDIAKTKRELALSYGAKACSSRELMVMMMAKKNAPCVRQDEAVE